MAVDRRMNVGALPSNPNEKHTSIYAEYMTPRTDAQPAQQPEVTTMLRNPNFADANANDNQPNFSTPQTNANVPTANAAVAPQVQNDATAQAEDAVAIESLPTTQYRQPTSVSVASNPMAYNKPSVGNAQQATSAATTPADENAIKSNPYRWLMNKLGPREMPQNIADLRKQEKNQAKVAGMLGLFTGIGNMLISSSNRYGRGVQSPDFAKPVSEGIAAREKKRREDAALQQERDYKNQQIQMQRDKANADAADRAWNRAYKNQQLALGAQQKAAELDLKAKNADADRKSRETIASDNRKAQDARAAADRSLRMKMHTDRMNNPNGYGSNSKRTSTATNITLQNGYEMNLPHEKWEKSPENVRRIFDMANKLHPEYFGEESKWYEDGTDKLKVNDELRQAIASYMEEYPYDDVTKEMMRLAGDDPDNPEIRDKYFTTDLSAPSSSGQTNTPQQQGGTYQTHNWSAKRK